MSFFFKKYLYFMSNIQFKLFYYQDNDNEMIHQKILFKASKQFDTDMKFLTVTYDKILSFICNIDYVII